MSYRYRIILYHLYPGITGLGVLQILPLIKDKGSIKRQYFLIFSTILLRVQCYNRHTKNIFMHKHNEVIKLINILFLL